MNKIILFLLLLLSFNISKAQISALTDDGKQVFLYSDGTWKYASPTVVNSPDSIKINPVKFSKSPTATFMVKSNVVNVGVFIDPAKWTFASHHDNEVLLEYRFTLKSGNGGAMLESEKTPVNLVNMKDIALMNAQKAAVDAKIESEEYRIVNNNKILFLTMSGTIKGIKFRYMGYYFSNERGTIQLLSYTTEAMYKDARRELETFLNGLVVIN
jgi:hypothetical protein